MIDQIYFTCFSSYGFMGHSIPIVNSSHKETENIGVRMYPSLMGTFNFFAPILYINSMSDESSSSLRPVSFCASYFDNPWNLPSLTMSYEGHLHIKIAMPLYVVNITYQAILDASTYPDPSSSWMEEVDPILEPIWVVKTSSPLDFLANTFPLDESILEDMIGSDRSSEDLHQRSYFLPELERIEQYEFRSTKSEIVGNIVVSLDKHEIYVKGTCRISLLPL
jgi:hypothetical protein